MRSIFAAILTVAFVTPVQAAVVVSNLSETTGGTVGVIVDSFAKTGRSYAQSFTTGAAGSVLEKVTLSMSEGINGDGGFAVKLYGDNGDPSVLLANLTGDVTPGAGLHDYTGAIPLSANTTYWIVASAFTFPVSPRYDWRWTASGNQTGSAGWSLGDAYRLGQFSGTPSNVASWQATAGRALQMSIAATVPEPSGPALFTFAMLMYHSGAWHRRGRRVSGE